MGFLDEVLDNVGKPYNASKGFEHGTHEVIIGEAEATTKKTQKDDKAAVINVVVFDENDNEKTAQCTLYFHTEGGARMSVTKILGILVHNVPEEKKDAVRELGKKLFGNVDTPEKSRDIAIKLITDKLVGKKAYLVAEPQGKYLTTAYGDLWHYPAKAEGGDDNVILDGKEATDISSDDLPDFEV